MSRAPARNGAAPRRPGDEDDICPVCKSSRYLNPSMRFLVNPECYHKIRHKEKGGMGVFNKREEEFESLRDWNNYLEEVENLTWNLLQGVDVKETEKKLDAYKRQNEQEIKQNAAIESQENANTEAQFAAQREQARLRREAARNEELDERREKEEGRREMVDMMARGDGDADTIARETQKVVLKKSTARRTAAERSRQQAAAKVDNGAAGPSLLDPRAQTRRPTRARETIRSLRRVCDQA
ncbi:hypothetical protein HO173_005959 [Letharia columbiana]|uniref:RNA polymerase II transcription factor B p38 subunit n=1 Tax=Letharia columbiana TaxID=112416 RepID=A0A8H6FW35_9LECA|nr:uncharacterized protein HO173_005959 [Letharia columbiana]KAF6235764.1 hypothetical protein HO173_005959 [Letharia columbiana]